MQRNLLLKPCWEAKDLGKSLPDSPHAVSVALPRWEDVIAYEENKPTCMQKLQSIYPRFGLNPLLQTLSRKALNAHGAKEGSSGWPYSNFASAEKAKQHCAKNNPNAEIRIKDFQGLKFLIVDFETTSAAKAFWQHTGIGASSREAAIALNKEKAPTSFEGEAARTELKKRLSNIYCCEPGLIQLHPSGMAALTSALTAIDCLKPKSPCLQIGFPYVDVLKLPQRIFSGSHLILQTEVSKLSSEIDLKKPSALIVELPSNPMLQCIDLPSISKLAHEKNVLVIADDTIGSPLNIDPLPYADLIFSSLTKSFAGQGDILAGSLVVSPYSPWKKELTTLIQETNLPLLSDPDSIALEKASRDVHDRIPKLNQACLSLKNSLENHYGVSKVFHPENCSNFKELMRPRAGHGCLLSFELKGGLEKSMNFYNALKVCKGPSLGTNFTLVCPYVLLAHYNELTWAKSCGVSPHLLRVSVGLENQKKLWECFENALQA